MSGDDHNNTTETVAFVGGPYGGQRARLAETPPRIDVGLSRYERVDDPDTGDSLGGYVYRGEVAS